MSERTTHHKIVVGTDGSSSALVAVQWAAREAAMRHVSLTVVHVASSLPVAASVLTWPAGHIPQEVLEIQDSEARAILAEAIRTAEDTMGGAVGIEIGSEQYLGSPVSALTTLSKTAQLVVVACRGDQADTAACSVRSVSVCSIMRAVRWLLSTTRSSRLS